MLDFGNISLNFRVVFTGAIIGLFAFFTSLMADSVISWLVLIFLLIASIRFDLFFKIVVPFLACFTAYEANISANLSEVFLSPHTFLGVGSLWVLCSTLFSFSLLSQVTYSLRFKGSQVWQYLLLLCVFFIATFYFINMYGGLSSINKEPFRIFFFLGLYVFFGSYIIDRLSNNINLFITSVYVLIVAIITHRVASYVLLDLKDVGSYAYLIVPLLVWLGWVSKQNNNNWLFVFALLALLLSFRVSRTEILLAAIIVPIFLIMSYRRQMLFYLIFTMSSVIVLLSYYMQLDNDILLYLTHKLNFFSLTGIANIGNSATVRLYEFYNLILGSNADVITILFGKGAFGYITFDSYFTDSIFSVNSFSDQEHATGKYYKLHFFLTESLFYFGAIGLMVILTLYRDLLSLKSISLVFALYFVLIVMYRNELLFLIPIYHSVLIRSNYDKTKHLCAHQTNPLKQ